MGPPVPGPGGNSTGGVSQTSKTQVTCGFNPIAVDSTPPTSHLSAFETFLLHWSIKELGQGVVVAVALLGCSGSKNCPNV
jgi:hypothetical protein